MPRTRSDLRPLAAWRVVQAECAERPPDSFHLFGGRKLSFSDLERAIPAISQKMLIQQLRQLERDAVVARIVPRTGAAEGEYP